MKKYLILILILKNGAINTAEYLVRDTNLVTPTLQLPIKPSDLNHIATTGSMYTINRSGRYYLSQNLTPSPSSNGLNVINITASNVILDLNSKTIVRNIDSRTGNNLTAINIAPELHNVVILNGYIQGDNGNNQYINTGINIGANCHLITLDNIKVHECVGSGIIINSANSLIINNCAASRCQGTSSLNGLNLISCQDITITNSSFNENSTSNGKTVGINLANCQNVNLSNCQACCNNTTTSTGTAAYGVQLNNCCDCIFTDCKMTNNNAITTSAGALMNECNNCQFKNCNWSISNGKIAYGINITNSQNCTFKDCISNNHISTAGIASGFTLVNSPINNFKNCTANYQQATGGEAIGFDIQLSSDNCILKNCVANNNIANSSAMAAYGIKLASNYHYLKNCICNNNNSLNSTSGNCYGIYLNSANNNQFLNCQTNHNISMNSDAYGAYLISSKNNIFLNCLAKGNTAQTNNNEAVGYYSSGGATNRFEQCIANSQICNGTTGGTLQLAAGFKFQNNESYSQILNCEAAGNNGGSGTASRAYGIFMSGTNAATYCLVQNCKLINNIITSGRRYGFYDASTNISTALLSNLSVGHGPCLTSTTLNSKNIFIDTQNSGLNYFYNLAATSDSPKNIIYESYRYILNTVSNSTYAFMNISLY